MKQSINEVKKMQRIAGLISEEEYRKSLINESKVNNSYMVQDAELVAKYGDEDHYYIDKQKALDYLSQFDNDYINAKLFINDDEVWGVNDLYLEDGAQRTNKEIEDIIRQEMSYYFFNKPDEI
jgi:hypothetical protein